MAAIDYLKQRGLSAVKKGNRVHVSPKAAVTDDVRQYIRSHRLELMAELAANDGVSRSSHWQVVIGGKPICTMVGEPKTYAEATAEVKWRWPDAEVVQ